MSTAKIIINLAESNARKGLLRSWAVEGMALEATTPEEARVMVPLKSANGTSI